MGTSGRPDAAVAADRPRRQIDWLEIGLLAAFAAASLWVIVLDLFQVVVHGRVWTGTDGVYLVDQMQYLAWIRDASHHLAASNLFVLRSTPADYFQPAIAISAAFTALGMAPSLALLLWKPVAVLTFFYASRGYVNRSLSGRWPRLAALTLALFFASFTVIYGSITVIGDLIPAFLSWGYEIGLVALAASVAALLAYEKARTDMRAAWGAALLGGLSSLMHPWNGELLIALVVGAELVQWHRGDRLARRWQRPALVVAVTALPLLYYVLLDKVDPSWQLARAASRHSFPQWGLLLAMLPLLVPAAIAFRRPPKTFLASATRVWPAAAFAVFVFSKVSSSGTPLHAFQGITIPLGVLAVEGAQLAGWNRLRRPRLAGALVVAVLTVPATIYVLNLARELAAPTTDNANFIAHDERSAIDYLARDTDPGGVLTRSYLGSLIPGRTGRRTLIGDCLWSQPHCYQRGEWTKGLFDGTLSEMQARMFVLQSGARFVLSDCQTTVDLDRMLKGLAVFSQHFGCAAVYEIANPGTPSAWELAATGSSTRALAESPRYAAVRASRRQ